MKKSSKSSSAGIYKTHISLGVLLAGTESAKFAGDIARDLRAAVEKEELDKSEMKLTGGCTLIRKGYAPVVLDYLRGRGYQIGDCPGIHEEPATSPLYVQSTHDVGLARKSETLPGAAENLPERTPQASAITLQERARIVKQLEELAESRKGREITYGATRMASELHISREYASYGIKSEILGPLELGNNCLGFRISGVIALEKYILERETKAPKAGIPAEQSGLQKQGC